MGHSEMLLAVAGLQAERIKELTRQLADGDWSEFPPAEALAFSFAYKLTKNPADVSDDDVQELVATFGLLMTIIIGIRHKPEAVPALVAMWVVAGYWFTSSTNFANPAVTIARALTDTFAGIRPDGVIGFIIAQLIGATLALYISRWLIGPEKATT